MIINLELPGEKLETKVGSCPKLKRILRGLSLANLFTGLILLLLVVIVFYLFKTYIWTVLVWLENQDSLIILLVIVFLFIIVSFPVTVGYIVLVCSSGYLFGILKGFILSVIGANCGVAVAHCVIKLVGHHNAIRTLMESEIAKAITRVINGPMCFKIVFCTRLTPIPFGLQNTIFALSNVGTKIYHLATFLGLLPAQFVSVYVGSTLRSMQDVLEHKNIPTSSYFFIIMQLVLGASVLLWVGATARKELLKALTEGDNRYNTTDKLSTFNIV